MRKKIVKEFKLKNFNGFQLLFLILIISILCYVLATETHKTYKQIRYQGSTNQKTSNIVNNETVKKDQENQIDTSPNAKIQVVNYFFLDKDGVELSYRSPETEKLIVKIKPNISEDRFKKIDIKPLSNQSIKVKFEGSDQISIEFLDKFEEIDGYSFISISENSELIFKIAYFSTIVRDLIYPSGSPSYR